MWMISIFNIVKIAGKAGCAGFALGFITPLSPERNQDALSSAGGGQPAMPTRRQYRFEPSAITHRLRHGRENTD
jgi:hypothetical protein